MLPPGLGFCALSDKAWALNKTSRLPKYYFDLAAERKTVAKNEAHFTPAVSIVIGLRTVHPDARARGAGQRVQAPRPPRAGHPGRRRGPRPRSVLRGDAEPGRDGGDGAARVDSERSSRASRRRTTSRSPAGRAR